MKIIKKGTPPDKEIFRGTCHYCKTEVEFERGEGTYRSCQKDGDWCEVKCPVCKNVIYGYSS